MLPNFLGPAFPSFRSDHFSVALARSGSTPQQQQQLNNRVFKREQAKVRKSKVLSILVNPETMQREFKRVEILQEEAALPVHRTFQRPQKVEKKGKQSSSSTCTRRGLFLVPLVKPMLLF